MKLAVLITGQIRNEHIFADLCESVSASRHLLSKIGYASWPNELAKGRAISAASAPELPIKYIDCGAPLPISSAPNGSITSFLFQYQQIAKGLSELGDDDTFVLRLRADMTNPAISSSLIRLISEYIKNHDCATRSMIVGSISFCGLFIEDRIMMVSPTHARRILAFPLNDISRYNPKNLFPEFLFYSIAANVSDDNLMYDFRFRLFNRKKGGLFTDYDFLYFGPEYKNYVERYKLMFAENYMYLDDCFGDTAEYVEIRDRLPRFCSIYSQEALFRELDGEADAYSREYEQRRVTAGATPDPRDPLESASHSSNQETRDTLLSCAKQIAYIEYLYHHSKNGEIIALSDQIKALTFFRDEALERLGCSLFVGDCPDEAFDILFPMFERGYEGFECLYYLCVILKMRGEMGRLWKVAQTFKAKHSADPRVGSHILTYLGCDPDEFFDVILKQNKIMSDDLEAKRSELEDLRTRYRDAAGQIRQLEDKQDRFRRDLNAVLSSTREELQGSVGVADGIGGQNAGPPLRAATSGNESGEVSGSTPIELSGYAHALAREFKALKTERDEYHKRYAAVLDWCVAYNQSTLESLSWKATWLLRVLRIGRPARPKMPDFMSNGVERDREQL
ncbi:hypothetical protein SAMN02799622_05853 [Methylobacterium sp. UNC378MF]|nr:hypothetical protein SAMN02799622_05853 [Methylobacterium sp. UNC378MF]